MSEILTPKEWSAEFMCVIDATVDEDASVRACEAEDRLKAHDVALRAEVESLRERLGKEEEERWRQYGMRVRAEERAAFLLELLRATVRTGTKDPLLDARLAEEIRSHE